MREIYKRINEIKADLSRETTLHDRAWYEKNAFLIDYDAIRAGEWELSKQSKQLIDGLEEQFKANVKDAKLEITSELVGDTRERGGHRGLKDLLLGKHTSDYATYDLYTIKIGPYEHQFAIMDRHYVYSGIDYYENVRDRDEVSLEDAKFNKRGTQGINQHKFEEFAAPGYGQPEPEIVIFPTELERYQTEVKMNVLVAFEQTAKASDRFSELHQALGLNDAITVCALENEDRNIADKNFTPQEWSDLLQKFNALEYKWYNNEVMCELNEMWQNGDKQEALEYIASIDRYHALSDNTKQFIVEKEEWAKGLAAEITKGESEIDFEEISH